MTRTAATVIDRSLQPADLGYRPDLPVIDRSSPRLAAPPIRSRPAIEDYQCVRVRVSQLRRSSCLTPKKVGHFRSPRIGIGQNPFNRSIKTVPAPPNRREFTGTPVSDIRRLPRDDVVSKA